LASLSRLVRTATFRLAAVYALLLAVSSVILFGAIYLIAGNALQAGLRASVEHESQLLVEELRSQVRRAQLAEAIEQRILAGASPTAFFLLRDASGHRIAGNIDSPGDAEGWITLNPSRRFDRVDQDDQDERQVIAFARRLEDGTYLLVGEDSYRIVEAKEAMLQAFSWAAGALLVLAALGGVAVSAGFLRRIDAINRTTKEIVDGRLSQRIPIQGTGDELDRLGANLNGMLDRIESLMDSLKQVSTDIAHEMRTPLSRLRQHLERAQSEARTMSDYHAAVERSIAEADATLATFGALLRIAQIEAGSRRAGFAELNLSEMLDTILDTYAAVAEDAGRTLRAKIEPGVWTKGDRDLLLQMIVNVVENALRHTPAGTSVVVELDGSESGPLLAVADNGPGIPQAEYGRVFRRFYRLQSSRTTAGSGLGLALVAAVAHLHRIRIELRDNAPGLRVQFRFPAQEAVPT
jgi:signal transduction histidine kinase